MGRKTRAYGNENTEPIIRTAKENARMGRGWLTYMLRAALGVSILANIFLLSRPDVREFIGTRIENRLEARGGADTHGGITRGDAELATLFTPEIMFWRDDIIRWGKERNLNPNLIATIMQIESCGDPFVSSHAGAQGLFQVMPLHFDNDENQINPETNAQNGLDHLRDCLVWTNYDVAVTFACYNAGPSVLNLPFEQWYEESRSYYKWGTGIYGDASNGEESSPTLNEWLAAGGSRLCQNARFTQDFVLPNLVSQP